MTPEPLGHDAAGARHRVGSSNRSLGIGLETTWSSESYQHDLVLRVDRSVGLAEDEQRRRGDSRQVVLGAVAGRPLSRESLALLIIKDLFTHSVQEARRTQFTKFQTTCLRRLRFGDSGHRGDGCSGRSLPQVRH